MSGDDLGMDHVTEINAAAAGAWAGRHVLWVAAALLLAVALAVVLVVHLGAAVWARLPSLPIGGRWRLALVLAGGASVLLAGAWTFAELAENVGAGEPLAAFDSALLAALPAGLPDAALPWAAALTRLGDPPTLALLVLLACTGLLLGRQRAAALLLALAAAGNAALNPALKQLVARARPPHADGEVHATGFSFPSGHSSGSLVVFGALAFVLLPLLPPRWRGACAAALLVLAVSIAFSRVLLRVHYPSDVLAGLLTGGCWLAVCVLAARFARAGS
jgi:undecaprenyl-diphosphatase